MYNEILSSIDNIDECVMEAEMNVLTAMINEYDKAIMIMENYNGDSYDCFDIFMEASDESIFGSKDENIFKRILMFIPRLISKVITIIQRAISKKIHGEVFTDINFNMIDVYIGKIDALLYDVLVYIESDCTKILPSLQDGTIQNTIEELNKLTQSPDNFKQDTSTKVGPSYYDMKKTFKYISKKMSGNVKRIEKFRDSLNKEGSISDDKISTDVKKLLNAIMKFYQVIYKIFSEPKNHLIKRKQSEKPKFTTKDRDMVLLIQELNKIYKNTDDYLK